MAFTLHMRVFRIVFLVAVVMLGIWLLLRVLLPTDEKRIARIIEQGRSSVVRRNIAGVMVVVDSGYYDEFGMDYDQLRRWFQGQFRLYDSITCVIPRMVTHLDRTAAVCTLTVWFAGYTLGRKTAPAEVGLIDGFPVYGDEVVLALERKVSGWRVVSASP